jgi:hypothetical protein
MTKPIRKTKVTPPPAPPPVVAAPIVVAPVAAQPPPAAMVNFPGKGEVTLDDARRFSGTYGQFLKKQSPEICADGVTTPTCRADIAAVAAVMHTQEYAKNGDENSRTMAIMSVDTLYSLAPSEETFLLMLTLRQQLGIDLVRLQKKMDTTASSSAVSWGPSTYLMSDAVALKASLKHLDRIDAKLSQNAWTLEKTVAKKILDDQRGAIHTAIKRAHVTDSLAANLQSARMEGLVGNREAAVEFLANAQTTLSTRSPLTTADQLAQITIWHRHATLTTVFAERQKMLKDASDLLEKLPSATPQRASLAIENVALMAQLEEQEIRVTLKGNRGEDTVLRIRNVYDAAIAKAEKWVDETNAKGVRTIKLDPLLELKATLAEQQLGIAFAWHTLGDAMTRAKKIRDDVAAQLTTDVAGYNVLVHPQTLSAFKARHYWALAQFDFFTGNIQSALVHLQTIASQHQGTPHEAMLWHKDNWPYMAGIVSADRAFSDKLNHKSIEAGARAFMQAYLQRRGTAFLGCEAGALAFTLGTAAITKQFSSAAALAGCFSGNAAAALNTWTDASDLIRQSYITGLSPVTDIQAQEMRTTLLMQTAVIVASGMGGVVAQGITNTVTLPLQRRLLAGVVSNGAPWLSNGLTVGLREASHVAGGLTMGTISNAIYSSLGEDQNKMPMVDHWLTYSVLGWLGHLNPGMRIFGRAGISNAVARAFTNVSLAGWAMASYGAVRHPDGGAFLENAADTTAFMGVLHGTLSVGRLIQSSGKFKLPQPLDELAVEQNPELRPVGDIPVDLVVRRRLRKNSDRILGVNAVVSGHIDTFVEEISRITALTGRLDPALAERVHLARASLNELVSLSEAGLVVDVRQLDIIWKTPSLTQHDFRVASLRILEEQINKGHIKRIEPGVVVYVKTMESFHIPDYFRVVDPHSWGLTRTNIAGLTEAVKQFDRDPLLQYLSAKVVKQVDLLPPSYATIKQYCRDTLIAEYRRQNFNIEDGVELTPIPDLIMSGKMLEPAGNP